jgi:cellobiose phosphorylase
MLCEKRIFNLGVGPMHMLGDLDNFAVQLSADGSLLSMHAGEILLSRTVGSPIEGGLARLYLREHVGGQIRLHQLLGPATILTKFVCKVDSAQWSGQFGELSICLDLYVDAATRALLWTVDVRNSGCTAVRYDTVWMQDVGCATRAALECNEAYAAHYLDQSVQQDHDFGPVLMFRQNLLQGGGQHPWLLAACLSGAESYATDAFDLFGNGYRCGKGPSGLQQVSLSNRCYQFEFSCAALQSTLATLQAGESSQVCFGLQYQEDHPEASSGQDLIATRRLRELCESHTPIVHLDGPTVVVQSSPVSGPRLHGATLSSNDLQDLYPSKWRHLEGSKDQVLSFFVDQDTHVVTNTKEALVERPHGSMLVGDCGGEMLQNVLATTVYMAGIFSAQTVLGNTAFHCMNTLPREPLGLSGTSGLRIYMETASGWHALGVPSVFEMQRDRCSWVYKFEDALVRVSLSLGSQRDAFVLSVESSGESCRYLLANELVAEVSDAEVNTSDVYDAGLQTLVCRFQNPSHSESVDLVYGISWHGSNTVATVGGSELLGSDGLDTLSVIVTDPGCTFQFRFSAAHDGAESLLRKLSSQVDAAGTESEFWGDFNRGLAFESGETSLSRLDDALRWYSHNGLIHYASPHGLEQYMGAAWGTRDACQGPFEYFIAQQHHGLARRILLRTFSSQFADTGDWPQWFMHDEYTHFAQHHSHGDVVVWPLKALGMYLEATGDQSILNEPLTYLNADNSCSDIAESLILHVERALVRIEHEFIPGTYLIRYGGGDWDDSLQPVNQDLAVRLVSGWTVGLLAQSLSELNASLVESDLKQRVGQMADAVRDDFRKHVLIDGQVAGFLLFDEGYTKAEPLLHPMDARTGMSNRLIPMTRSIIAGLLTPAEAEHQMQRIAECLKFPDGVRLMDRPAPYQGGLETFFKRAESAANFGREIGLQYVHAHIRYAEALAKMGRADEFYAALLTICPVSIKETVPNAELRQANMYFSSSDGAFLNRADAAENYEKLRDGSIPVKGGWRLYSSGPGLYIGVVIRQLFGLRELADAWVFDPVLPQALDGVELTWQLFGKPVQITFQVTARSDGASAVLIDGCALAATREANPYRNGGLIVSKAVLADALQSDARLTVQL